MNGAMVGLMERPRVATEVDERAGRQGAAAPVDVASNRRTAGGAHHLRNVVPLQPQTHRGAFDPSRREPSGQEEIS